MDTLSRAVCLQSRDTLALNIGTNCPIDFGMPVEAEAISFRSIIDLWPSADAMAGEIGAGVAAVRKWSQRDRIPAEWWSDVLAAPRVKKAHITAELMAMLAARAA